MLTKLLTNPALLLVLGLLALLVFAKLIPLLIGKPAAGAPLPYASQGFLLTPAERSFLGVAARCLGQEFVISPKVRLADLLAVAPGQNRSVYQRAFNRIAAKHVDFVICRGADYAIAGVVELDDRTHERASRVARDYFVDQALDDAGIPVLHIKASNGYEPRALADQLARLLSPSDEGPSLNQHSTPNS